MNRVKNKICLVTGGANGIGEAISRLLVSEGATVVITDLADEKGKALVAELSTADAQVYYRHQDVTNEAQWNELFDWLETDLGRLDVMVNNAGGGTYNDLETLSLSDWHKVMALNVDSTFLGTQRAVALMKKGIGGSIVNMSSVGGLVGSPNLVAYSAAKAAVKLFSKCAAIHCGQQGYNIRVNTVHPGLIKTEAGMDMATKATGMSADEAEAAFTMLHPIGRLGRPTEIAAMVLFLASDESSFATGGEFVVDGGYTSI